MMMMMKVMIEGTSLVFIHLSIFFLFQMGFIIHYVIQLINSARKDKHQIIIIIHIFIFFLVQMDN